LKKMQAGTKAEVKWIRTKNVERACGLDCRGDGAVLVFASGERDGQLREIVVQRIPVKIVLDPIQQDGGCCGPG